MILKKLIGVAAITLPTVLFAQKDITISESDKEISAGTKNSYVVLIPEAKSKEVNQDWQKMLKKDTKGKVEDNKGEVKGTLIAIKNISLNPLTIYSKSVETKEGVQLSAWFADGDSIFISTAATADKSLAVQKYMHDFAVQEYKAVAKTQLETEQKAQKDLQKIYDGFVKDQKKAENAVTNAQKEIARLQDKNKDEEGNIKQAIANKNANKAIADQQKNLDAEQKHAKELQGYIKDQQKAEDNIKSNNKRIEKLQDKIKEESAAADKAKQNQGPASSNIDAQKAKVAAASDKLNNIK
jgi:hypothetical protein